MEIRRIKVAAFKSLYDLEAEFDHLSVVTGPNGAGKSNLVDALTFLSDAHRHDLEFAVSRAGGYENIAHRRTRRAKRPISFEVEAEVSAEDLSGERGVYWRRHLGEQWPSDLSLRMVHGFSFHAASQKLLADFEILEEWLIVSDAAGQLLVDLRFRGQEMTHTIGEHTQLNAGEIAELVRPFLDKDFAWDQWGRAPGATELVVTGWRYLNVAGLLSEHVGRVKVFQLSPHLSRTSGVATPNAELGRFGENVPGAADNLRRRSPDAWQRVEEAMRSIVPGLTQITIVPTEDRRLAVQFKERGVGRPWNSAEVSDGTIQTFALLIALFDPRASMLMIEEPENAVHPWILRHLIDLTTESPRQILFTTHSPVLLDYVNPEIVWLMWMREGRSALRRFTSMDPDLTADLVSGKLSLFETYVSGFFPEAVPRGLSEVLDEVDS
ncbi:putative ATPase [Frondihabitans sp. PhB188]|uniref:AAA family ATPase n=1 Tax=Frondihabitans sp. PhB188 TaxID=2485200 RepID=UPI000F481279|nr:AAA family ATPase [Frondihabitans sp. PhB188]ROQ31002.1 putative ATPase [Frondihabitans sp. PhB188]